MRLKDSKPGLFFSKIFRRKGPNKFKKSGSAIGKTQEGWANSRQTMRSVLSRSSSIDSDPSVKSINIDNDSIDKSLNIDNIDPNIKTPVSRSSSSSNGGGAAPGGGTFLEFMRLRKKILMFREIFDIPPLNGSVAIHELVAATIEDLNRMYPDLISGDPILKMKERNTHQGLICLYDVLDCIADSWVEDKSVRDKFKLKKPHTETSPLDELVEQVLEILDCINNAAKERFELMDVELKRSGSFRVQPKPKPTIDCNSEYSRSPASISPHTPTSAFSDSPRVADLLGAMLGSYSSPQLLNLRAHTVEKLSPLDLKRLVVQVMPQLAGNDNFNHDMKQISIEPKGGDVNNDVGEETESGGKMEEEKNEQYKEEEKEMGKDNLAKTGDVVVDILQSPPLQAETDDEIEEILQLEPSPLSSPTSSEIRKDDVVEMTQPSPLQSPTPEKIQYEVGDFQLPLIPSLTTKNIEDEVVKVVQPPPSPSPPSPNSVSTPASVASPKSSTPSAKSSNNTPSPKCIKIPSPPPPPMPATTSAARPQTPPPSPCYSPPKIHSLPPSSDAAPPPPPPAPGSVAAPPAPPPAPGSGAAPPPPPPAMGKGGNPPPPPGPMMKEDGAPPPPSGARTSIRQKNRSKLKRSTHMGNLYRILRGKVEGSSLPGGKPSQANKNANNGGGNAGGGGGGGGGSSMADALAEMTKRSAYFQQIEGDMEKHGSAVKELQHHLSAFKNNDMDELLKFNLRVELVLELLTDETQILSRFESFPMKKLETLRMAAALSMKLNGIVLEIQNWKPKPPLAENLDKVEKYFNKMKSELEGLERTKDEESRKFQSQNIYFDFSIFTKIKECMVDLSSGFIELALKERREAKVQTNDKTDGAHMLSVKMLWRAFQFAFKVYSFAGGQDERADSLTRELAKEIETDPMQE